MVVRPVSPKHHNFIISQRTAAATPRPDVYDCLEKKYGGKRTRVVLYVNVINAINVTLFVDEVVNSNVFRVSFVATDGKV